MQTDNQIDIFCQNIKTLRINNGLSKKEMTKILGICSTSLAKIEKGILPPRINTIIIFKICKRFNKKPHELFVSL